MRTHLFACGASLGLLALEREEVQHGLWKQDQTQKVGLPPAMLLQGLASLCPQLCFPSPKSSLPIGLHFSLLTAYCSETLHGTEQLRDNRGTR